MFSLPAKTYIFIADKGFAPPPLTDMSPKNVSLFFDGSPQTFKCKK